MEQKNKDWFLSRVGYLSASNLDKLMSKGRGKEEWGQTAISYLYGIERQRWLKEPPEEISAPQLKWGTEQEPYAVEWIRENVGLGPDVIVRHYETDFDQKPFIKVDWAKYGASPDADLFNSTTGKIEALVEIKSVWGDKDTAMYFSPSRPFEKKKADAFEAHKEQMAGQLLAFPDVDSIFLMKYDGQTDSEFDMRDPLDFTRGIMFYFNRSEFGDYLDKLKERIIKADQYLDLGYELDLINEYYK